MRHARVSGGVSDWLCAATLQDPRDDSPANMNDSHRDWLRAARAGSLEAMRALHEAATPDEQRALAALVAAALEEADGAGLLQLCGRDFGRHG